GVEDVMGGPDRDDHRLPIPCRGLEHELGQDPVLLADRPALGDPIEIPAALGRRYADRSQAHDHAGMSFIFHGVASASRGAGPPSTGSGSSMPLNHRHSTRSYAPLTAPAMTKGAPTASVSVAPANSGPTGLVRYRAVLV